MRNYNTKNKENSQNIIFNAISDGQWHRYKELIKTTKLSTRTLTKRLKELTKLNFIERKEDRESGKYPFPTLYRAEPEFLTVYILPTKMRENFANNIEEALEETKTPTVFLDLIHINSSATFKKILNEIQKNEKITYEEVKFMIEAFLWADYNYLTLTLIKAVYKKEKQKMDTP